MEYLLQRLQMIKKFAAFVVRHFSDNRCTENAAALTYTTLFAVVPMMTVTYSMLSAVPSLNGAGESIQNFVFDNFVPSTGEAVQSYLQDFSQQARKLTFVGIAFLLVTSFMMLRTIDKALNQIWQVHQVRRGISGFLLYWAILSLGPLLLGAGFLLTSYLASLQLVSDTTALFGGETWLLRLMPMILSTMMFTLLYSAVPNRKVPFKHAFIGAAIVALLVECAKGGFALFITLSPSYQVIYGAFAAVPLFLLWIYLSWIMVLLGAVIVRSLALFGRQGKGEELPPMISMLVILKELQNHFQQGLGLAYSNLQRGYWHLSLDDWEQHCARLDKMGIISKRESGERVLIKDLREVNLAVFCMELPWAMPADMELDQLADGSRPEWFSEVVLRLRAINQFRDRELDCSLDELLSR